MSTVSDLYRFIQYRPDLQVTADGLIPIVNMAIRTIAKRLYTRKSSLVTSRLALPITTTNEGSFIYLMDNFWGLVDPPRLTGDRCALQPSPGPGAELNPASGKPQFYRIIGRRLFFFPEDGNSSQVTYDYFARPEEVVDEDSILPFGELFDDLLADYLVWYFRAKPTGSDEYALRRALYEGVDMIIAHYGAEAPARPSGINWNNIT